MYVLTCDVIHSSSYGSAPSAGNIITLNVCRAMTSLLIDQIGSRGSALSAANAVAVVTAVLQAHTATPQMLQALTLAPPTNAMRAHISFACHAISFLVKVCGSCDLSLTLILPY